MRHDNFWYRFGFVVYVIMRLCMYVPGIMLMSLITACMIFELVCMGLRYIITGLRFDAERLICARLMRWIDNIFM